MRSRNFSVGMRAVALVALAVFYAVAFAAAQQEVILHQFNGNDGDGYYPFDSLIFDAKGNLYGTTYYGGTYGVGTIFELTLRAGGGWTEKLLHSFNSNGNDGFHPQAGLIFDASGNLYGTTHDGGAHQSGTVFELKPRAGGTWVERILHTFKSVPGDGIAPSAGLILDASGNLYGTTYAGGSLSGGTVFELKPTGGGGWVETVLYGFSTTNGYSPSAGLVFDVVGNLYGTTINGGTFSNGTVFELEPKKGGGWTESVLYNFDRNSGDGYGPTASLTFDQSHNLYGTTYNGGAYNGGTAFELTRTTGGAWTETIVHNFDANGVDGANPYSGLIFDGSGNLYGTATLGGVEGFGVVFELTPSGSGLWTETILHGFEENGGDGIYPGAGLIIDGTGNLYGTATAGGTQTGGIVFEIKP